MIDIETINLNDCLPHQDPVLMVHKMLQVDETSVITELTIEPDNIFIIDNQLSESGLIENAAQTCSIIVGQKLYATNKKLIGYINAIKSLKIIALPQVKQRIETHATMLEKYEIGQITTCTVSCKTYISEKLISKGIINLLITST